MCILLGYIELLVEKGMMQINIFLLFDFGFSFMTMLFLFCFIEVGFFAVK